jgi:hypothetical protein
MECQYCHNNFSNKVNLNVHQRLARYCLLLRQTRVKKEFICDGCDKIFSRLYNLTRHKTSCKIKFEIETNNKTGQDIKNNELQLQLIQLKEQLLQKDKQIKDLQDKLENVAIQAVLRPTTTNNTTTNNNRTNINTFIQSMDSITVEHLNKNANNLTLEHIKKGAGGYAEYALEYPFKDRLICVDFARRKVKFKDAEGNVITDPDMRNLSSKFFQSIRSKNGQLVAEYGENEGDPDTDTMINLLDYKTSVWLGSEGHKTDFHHDFVKEVCCKSVNNDLLGVHGYVTGL